MVEEKPTISGSFIWWRRLERYPRMGAEIICESEYPAITNPK